MSKRTRSSSELQIRNPLLRTTENRGQSRISSLQRRARLILQRAEYLPHEFESDPDFLAEEAHNVGRGIKRLLRSCRKISTVTLIFSHAHRRCRRKSGSDSNSCGAHDIDRGIKRTLRCNDEIRL